ncbi:MAG: hypothetical protein ACREJN_16200 [Nitrospiraceae bacterium]
MRTLWFKTLIWNIRVSGTRIFLPWKYWRERFSDDLTEVYHPEFGSYWQPKSEGGLMIMQAQDEGYKLGFKEGAAAAITEVMRGNHLVMPVEWEYKIYTTRSDTTNPALLRDLDAFTSEGWELVTAVQRTLVDGRHTPMPSIPIPPPSPEIEVLRCFLRRMKKGTIDRG